MIKAIEAQLAFELNEMFTKYFSMIGDAVVVTRLNVTFETALATRLSAGVHEEL